MVSKIQKTSYSRVWHIEDRAAPGHVPVYDSLARAQGFTQDFGDVTLVRVPDPFRYGKFKVIDKTRGAEGQPNGTLQFRYTRDASEMLRIGRKGCDLDIQIHMGSCQDPSDFDLGWEKILTLEAAVITTWGTGDLGALDQGEDAPVDENVPVTGESMYEILRVHGSELGETEITQEVVAVAICDSTECGLCGRTSDGCQRVFAMTKTSGGSPGAGARLISSKNGGVTLRMNNVSTMGAAENASDMACVGSLLVISSQTGEAVHYAAIADIVDGLETWAEVTTGIVAGKGPNAIFSLGRTFTWMVGQGGYVYFSSDITSGFEVQSAGSVTTQNLNDIHGIDERNLVAVGANNAVLRTTDGELWSAVTGPAVGVALNTVFMLSETEWIVGAANGRLYYTSDSGTSWTEKAFSGSGAGTVNKVWFPTRTVGYMAHQTAGSVGRLFRTVNGGYSWYLLPEDGSTFPSSTIINDVIGCSGNPNIAFAGGLDSGGSDGLFLKVA